MIVSPSIELETQVSEPTSKATQQMVLLCPLNIILGESLKEIISKIFFKEWKKKKKLFIYSNLKNFPSSIIFQTRRGPNGDALIIADPSVEKAIWVGLPYGAHETNLKKKIKDF